MKNVKCQDCGKKNYSGQVYCEKCSGNLYRQQIEEVVLKYYYMF